MFLSNRTFFPSIRRIDRFRFWSSRIKMIKKKHFRVKHQKVKLFRANEPILSVFMWGINHTVRRVVGHLLLNDFLNNRTISCAIR